MRIIALLLLSTNTFFNYSQSNQIKNIFSFQTENNQVVNLNIDTLNNIMIFELKQASELIVEIKESLNDSLHVFYYSSYFRGGGVNNEGLDLNYIIFNIGNFKYTIYSEYSAETDETLIGIRKENIITNYEQDSRAIYSTFKGSFNVFKDGRLIPNIEI